MLYSIRWRLIISYAALTLLTILLIGVVALSLLTRYMAAREYETLVLNAEAVARMAKPLLARSNQGLRLQQLAITSGFLTNTELTILDRDHRALAHSQMRLAPLDSRSALLSLLSDLSRSDTESWQQGMVSPVIVISGSGHPRGMFAMDLDEGGTQNEEAAALSLERRPGFLGDRLVIVDPGDASTDDGDTTQNRPVTLDVLSTPRIWRIVFGYAPGAVPPPAQGPQVTVPVQYDDQVVGYVQMTNRFTFFAEPLLAIRRALMVAGLGAVLVAVLLGFLMSRTLTAPLMALESATQQMEEGDLAVRAPETVGEIGDLSRRFNRMAARLQATFADLAAERDALRRFIADASHELRTPLTALRQFIEILQGQAGGEPETRSEFLGESQRQLERLQWMTGHLLDLSRLEGGVAALDIAKHDLSDLLEEALSPFRSTAAAKQIELRLSVPDGLDSIWCDRASLGMALANLLDNALKFTQPGGFVELAATAEAHATLLTVSDNGPGIQPADQEQIFERFYRGEISEQLPGAGLGLAIVKSAVEAHGGTVNVENRDGAIFAVELPTDPSRRQLDGIPPEPLA
ncbi:MAG: HAMP domain-containing sensor histidine kinase [Caldilineaceae bacterium]|nr:HAMP domain-containing sensor histidine kinase [Caldilineaceae bacterium]